MHKLYNSFFGLYLACSHEDFIDECIDCYAPMIIVCIIVGKLEHYTSGRLAWSNSRRQKISWLGNTPKGHVFECMVMFNFCKSQNNVETKEGVANQIFEVEPQIVTNTIIA